MVPRGIDEIVYSTTGNRVNVFTEDRSRVDGECCVGLETLGSVSTEFKSEVKKSITCGCFPQSYRPYVFSEKT